MAGHLSPTSWLLMMSLAFSLVLSCNGASESDQKANTYIVYMGDLPKGDFSASSLHTSMLQQVGSRASESLIRSYKRSFNGFVAKLTEEERKKLASMEGVVSVFPNEKKQLHTTRSWDFMGFPQGVRRAAGPESDIIVGMLDTGVWPESESFSDEGFGPLPSKWKGSCQSPANFTCNNKIIGAKYYKSDGDFGQGDIDSPRDSEGHGSHTASTAAGRLVSDANLFGLGSGTARGAVPGARIAVYKVCWSNGCSEADILAAFDDAIADGVDIISLSVGGGALDYFEDSIAIGAFHSMKNGILTSNSGGNSGPDPETISNVSPWSLTVAASTIDRKFVAKVKLDNSKAYEGMAINTFILNQSMYPLVYGGDVPNTRQGFTREESRYCIFGSLDKTLVNGTIVLCDALATGEEPLNAGAVGTVMQDDRYLDLAFSFPLPATYLNLSDGGEVYNYINITSEPTAIIEKSTEIKDELAPFVVSFSSRGPNTITSDILKPDLTAPGVDILAAWSLATTVTGDEGDTRVVPYNIISGTSMSCPHATGAAAYVKSFNPTWSPAAIKSALMTTASPMTAAINNDAEFAYGSGHIDPVKAVNPGLVYDAGEADYVKFLCGQGYSDKSLRLVTGDNSSFCSESNNATVWDLNYPSFAISSSSKSESVTRVFHRTVTNVGSPVSVYKATVVAPPGFTVVVEPSVLSFKAIGQKLAFAVTVSGVAASGSVGSGSLVWDDGVSQVRSPIVAFVASSS
ncbi:Cucumisin like [Actinidia chinensis var. chinensis]|uniref:Cucumisin like n=1 Tax=Actinidia chinensis var. chinensis TaxID=1590841 RepID=A0A2R6PAN9_ACTCC|nr:Cucumisin like [Actinidia chinensis var. chinensis]